ncbi:hypothetical protein HOO65_020800 [Ceratocystis lukuohia]|uniref:Uncharacterized protein n=1 Tax=Ceratocystis lukuohia TaxID=2019550 RepID=A0ABR4MPP5_9PEZI
MSSHQHPILPPSALEPLTPEELAEMRTSSQHMRQVHAARRQRQRIAASSRVLTDPDEADRPALEFSQSISYLPQHRSYFFDDLGSSCGATASSPAQQRPASSRAAVHFADTTQSRTFAAEATPATLAQTMARREPLHDEPPTASSVHTVHAEALTRANEDRVALEALLRSFAHSPPHENTPNTAEDSGSVWRPPPSPQEERRAQEPPLVPVISWSDGQVEQVVMSSEGESDKAESPFREDSNEESQAIEGESTVVTDIAPATHDKPAMRRNTTAPQGVIAPALAEEQPIVIDSQDQEPAGTGASAHFEPTSFIEATGLARDSHTDNGAEIQDGTSRQPRRRRRFARIWMRVQRVFRRN